MCLVHIMFHWFYTSHLIEIDESPQTRWAKYGANEDQKFCHGTIWQNK